jgi:hypothetical protein
LNDEKVLVWCAFSAQRIYGPYFFETWVKKENNLETLQIFFGVIIAKSHTTIITTFSKMVLLPIRLIWCKTGCGINFENFLWMAAPFAKFKPM